MNRKRFVNLIFFAVLGAGLFLASAVQVHARPPQKGPKFSSAEQKRLNEFHRLLARLEEAPGGAHPELREKAIREAKWLRQFVERQAAKFDEVGDEIIAKSTLSKEDKATLTQLMKKSGKFSTLLDEELERFIDGSPSDLQTVSLATLPGWLVKLAHAVGHWLLSL